MYFSGKGKDKWPQYPVVQGHVRVRDGDRHRHPPGVGRIYREQEEARGSCSGKQ